VAGVSAVLTDALLEEAEAAYDRNDQGWFNGQTTEVLVAMWAIACDINQGACWDDEVYDALAERGHFDKEGAAHV